VGAILYFHTLEGSTIAIFQAPVDSQIITICRPDFYYLLHYPTRLDADSFFI
jgi:hypothetical protein